ncbi:restriction endonuclease [Patescibacteria group bacterium]|nr:restriction endonuclease [Patescibacteria group bacterium]
MTAMVLFAIVIEKENDLEKVNLQEIDGMDGIQFENLISNLLQKMGFEVETTKSTGDGGIDIIAYSEQPIIQGRYIIQCKRHSSNISEPVIRDLYGVMTSERANKGILITNSCFTSASISFAKEKPIELIDGKKLLNLMEKYFDTADENNQAEYRLGRNKSLLIKGMVRVIEDCKEEYEAVRSGLIFRKRYELDINAFREATINECENISIFLKAMDGFIRVFNEPSSDENVAFKKSERHVERFQEFIGEHLKSWEKLYFIKVNSSLNKLLELWLEMHDSIFASLFTWKEDIENILKNPKEMAVNGKATCTFIVDSNFIGQKGSEISEELGLINKKLYGYGQENSEGVKQYEYEIPLFEQVLFRGIAKALETYKEEYNAFNKGMVFKKKKDIDREHYLNLVKEDIDSILYFNKALENVLKILDESDGTKSTEQAEKYITRFREIVHEFYNGWQKYCFLNIPIECTKLNELVMERYDMVFLYLFSYIDRINKFFQHSTEIIVDGIIDMSLKYDANIIMEKNRAIVTESNKIVDYYNAM